MNHKKAWSLDDKILANLKFPNISHEKRAAEYSEFSLVSTVNHGPPTGKYKYRCPDCGKYYGSEVEHCCKPKKEEI